MKQVKIACVDNDEVFGFLLKDQFDKYQSQEVKIDVWYFIDAKKALQHIGNYPFDLILLDLNMPIMNGFDFLDEYYDLGFHEKFPDTMIFVITSSMNIKDREKAMIHPVVKAYIEKPIPINFTDLVLEEYNKQRRKAVVDKV